MRGLSFAALMLALLSLIAPAPGQAQSAMGTGSGPQRHCQTITTCRFERGGSYRGCVSSYSCRVCTPVMSRCAIAGKRGTCSELRCGWGA